MASLVRKGIERWRHKGMQSVASSATTMGVNRALAVPALDSLAFRVSIRRIRARQRDESGLADVLETAYGFRGAGRYRSIAPAQIRDELRAFAEQVGEHDPETVLEIGSASGGTLYVWARHLASADTIVSLDLPGGSFGGGYDANHAEFFNRFDRETDIRCIRDDSHALSTKADVQDALGGAAVDFLFIDGDHTYGSVKADFELYASLVRDGGLIAFHDIVNHPNHPNCEVDRLWTDLKDENAAEEIIAAPDQDWAGIGLIRV